MYLHYEEKEVDGVIQYRHTPNGTWKTMCSRTMSEIITHQRAEILRLQSIIDDAGIKYD